MYKYNKRNWKPRSNSLTQIYSSSSPQNSWSISESPKGQCQHPGRFRWPHELRDPTRWCDKRQKGMAHGKLLSIGCLVVVIQLHSFVLTGVEWINARFLLCLWFLNMPLLSATMHSFMFALIAHSITFKGTGKNIFKEALTSAQQQANSTK